MTPDERIIARQRARIEELEEELRQMRAIAQPVDILPLEWKLQNSQQKPVLALATAPDGYLSHERAFQIVARLSTECDPRLVVSQQIFRARPKLKPYGIEILTRWGLGYEMPPASRAVVKAALEQRMPA